MSILFLDPLVLAAYGAVGVLTWLVVVGRFRSWFADDAAWTAFVWPLPLVSAAVPLFTGVVAGVLSRLGLVDENGGITTGAAYLAAMVVPWVWLGVTPPRWLLPAWARARLGAPVRASAIDQPGAVGAAHAWRGRGHGSRARWAWRVDADPGILWVEEGTLYFRARSDRDDDGQDADHLDEWGELDDEAVDQLHLSTGPELRLEPPPGGWWTRRRLEVDLGALDGWRISETRPWRDDGLLTMEVAGRRPLTLWVGDTAAVSAAITRARQPAADA